MSRFTTGSPKLNVHHVKPNPRPDEWNIMLVAEDGTCGCCRGQGDHRCGGECSSCDGSGRDPEDPICWPKHGNDCTCVITLPTP